MKKIKITNTLKGYNLSQDISYLSGVFRIIDLK
jgi:hypothetical protein